MDLHFGPGGKPLGFKGKVHEAMRYLREEGLDHMEIEFVRGVWMKESYAKMTREEAKKEGVTLSVHAPYYINLLSKEKEKVEASKQRLLKSAKIAKALGAKALVFHAGYYGDHSKTKAYELVKARLEELIESMQAFGIEVPLSPETTGKHSQFGSLEEVLSLGEELGVKPCVDFAHLHARTFGAFTSKEKFDEVFESIEKRLGSNALKELPIHFSGIEYTRKGERRHLPISSKSPDFRLFAVSACEFKVGGFVVSESPLLDKDAIEMRKIWREVCASDEKG